MSKVGRKPIAIGSVQVEIKGQEIAYKGSKDSGLYVLPEQLSAKIEDGNLFIERNASYTQKIARRDLNRIWGMHKALIANKISGAQKPFEQKVVITGLGYKAAVSGKKIVFSLGYSHKIDFELPEGVSVDVDKSGQNLMVKASDRALVGQVCSNMKMLRKTEPYKGTGIKLDTDVILRKAGKAKSS